MTKDVLITVSGLRLEGNEEEEIEVVTSGQYYNKNNKDYIIYEEYLREEDDVTKCSIIIDNDKVDIIKHGPANVHMIFDKDKRNATYYKTPYGKILMGFNTTDLKVEKNEDQINVFLKYNIDINNNHLTENDIIINIKSKKI